MKLTNTIDPPRPDMKVEGRTQGTLELTSLYSSLLAIALVVAALSTCSSDGNRTAVDDVTDSAAHATADADADPSDTTPGRDTGTARDSGEETTTEDTADAAEDTVAAEDGDVSEDSGPRRCNGHAALCDRTLAEITLAGTHNAMSNAEDGFAGPNQTYGLERQLEDGIRALMLDSYRENDELLFCHGSCFFGSSDAVEQLGKVRAFLDRNPNEFIVFIFQDQVPVADTVTMLEESGLAELAWVPPADPTTWPTLAELLDDELRVLVTIESGRDGSDWVLGAWDLYFDTPYSFEEVDDFTCSVNRGSTDNPLYLVNHWLAKPLSLPQLADEANAWDVLWERVESCRSEHGRLPNFVGVDFYERGDLFEVVDVLNGVRAPR